MGNSLADPPQTRAIANRTDFAILAETGDYIVLAKPAPLQVHPSKPTTVPTLWSELRRLLVYERVNGARLSIINRLDRETSGVVLVTKHSTAAAHFSRLMQARRVQKRYHALVWGWPRADRFTIEAPLRRQGEVRASAIWLKRTVHPDGQPALTRVRVLRRFRRDTLQSQRFSWLELAPITGRMHQLRVHLHHSGYPIVGDKIYGPDERCYLTFLESGWTPELEARLLLPRQALHAVSLAFEGHPLWKADPPDDWEAWLPYLQEPKTRSSLHASA